MDTQEHHLNDLLAHLDNRWTYAAFIAMLVYFLGAALIRKWKS